MTAQEQAEKLAPECPRCGGNTITSGSDDGHDLICADDECPWSSGPFKTEADAISWNRTPTPPDDVRLAEIRERAEKATKGPWAVDCSWTNTFRIIGGDYTALARMYRTCAGQLAEESNADFIAHARADIPWLLDRIATAYQAGFADARERAEKVAEEQAKFWAEEAEAHSYDVETNMRCLARMRALRDIASAVRAIKPGDANGRNG